MFERIHMLIMHNYRFLFVFLGFICYSAAAMAQINIQVNTSEIIAREVLDKYGININAGADHDINRAEGAQSLAEAIRKTGSKHLRYPGGEKSNYFVWTADPLNPDPTTNYWTGWYNNASLPILNFDEFMTLCKDAGAEAHINVAVSKWSPDLLNETMAAEWVKYSNITKGYGVKYWEIGNEMWHPDKNAGYDLDAIAAIVKLYSNSMKAVDPTIKIGVSWRANEMQQLIDLCGSALDFVSVSNYTDAGGASYSNYKGRNNVDLLKVDESLSLNTVISEFNHADWSASSWDLSNNTGKGIINFDLVGQILKSRKTEYGCMWNTRWFPKDGVYDEYKWDAFDNLNKPLPVIQPLALWQQFIKDDLVKTSNGDAAIVSYAAYDGVTRDLNIFLLNKETTAKSVKIEITAGHNYGKSEVWQYKGSSELDENPTIGKLDSVEVYSNQISYTLPSTSITVFKLSAKSLPTSFALNGGFETSELSPWTGTGSSGVNGDSFHTGLYSGYAEGLNASINQTITGLTPGTTYIFSAFVYNSSDSGGNIYLGVINSGGADVRRNYGTSDWKLISFQFTTGDTNTIADIYMSVNSTNTLGRIDDVFVHEVVTIPVSIIEVIAEDYKIYPNPVTGNYLNINLNSSHGVNKFEIYDASGRLKFVKKDFVQSDFQIDVSAYHEGIYYVRMLKQTGSRTTRIIVL
jgi:hypothetical protein